MFIVTEYAALMNCNIRENGHYYTRVVVQWAKCDNLFEGVNIILVQFFQRIGSLNPTRFSDPITDLSHFQSLTST